jgi:acyl-CoA oxidase
VPTRDDDAGLLDRDYHRALFRWREEHLRTGLARRLRRGVDEGGAPFDVFAQCQDHAEAMGRAHVERTVLEAFANSTASADPPVVASLERLCDLYALSTIEADRAWFLEHGRISTERSKAITATVGRLCEQLAPLAETFTDAFAVPDPLMAPIAFP